MAISLSLPCPAAELSGMSAWVDPEKFLKGGAMLERQGEGAGVHGYSWTKYRIYEMPWCVGGVLCPHRGCDTSEKA